MLGPVRARLDVLADNQVPVLERVPTGLSHGRTGERQHRDTIAYNTASGFHAGAARSSLLVNTCR